MSTQIVVPDTCEILGLGEPTHGEPAFGWVRNTLIRDLVVDRGVRSVALETDRVAALLLDDFVRDGRGSLTAVMAQGFSHGFGEVEANRALIEWLHDVNLSRPERERVAVYGFDAPTEYDSAPSPRPYLSHVCAYLGVDADVDALVGDDQRWSRTEAVMDARMSPGDTVEANALSAIAHGLLVELYSRAPELISVTSRNAWRAAVVHASAAQGLLAYHKQAARPVDESTRVSELLATRDAIMARNLLDVRAEEGRRGPTLVFAHNQHLQRHRSRWSLGPMDLSWNSAGAIVDSIIGPHYMFVAGSLGASAELGLGRPAPGTYEAFLDHAIGNEQRSGWGLVPASHLVDGCPRVDISPAQGYFPLDEPTRESADAILHISDAALAGNDASG